MTNISLYQAANDVAALLDQVDEDGVYPDEIFQALEKFENKGVAVTAYILNCEAQAQMISDAAKKMQERAKPLVARSERLRAYLKDSMKRTGTSEIKCPEFIAKLEFERDASVEIFDLKQIPADYMHEPKPVEPQPDKTLIKKAINDGFDVPGAKIVKNDRLTIK